MSIATAEIRLSACALTMEATRAPTAAPGTLVSIKVIASGTFVKPCSRYEVAPVAAEIEMQNRLAADTACEFIIVKLLRAGIITTPPPIPQTLLRIPAREPVGMATRAGIEGPLFFFPATDDDCLYRILSEPNSRVPPRFLSALLLDERCIVGPTRERKRRLARVLVY